jgi:hypothetical protein
MTKSVAILGCGPAGLLAAHAAEQEGWDFCIYSRKQKSKLYGSQYLHDLIPELDCGTGALIKYALHGTPEEYRHKVYGDSWDGTVSPEDLMTVHQAWDIRYVYDGLWDRYKDDIAELDIKPDVVLPYVFPDADLVLSTVPRKIWAEDGDVFESQKIWAIGDTDTVLRVSASRPPDNTVFCDGTDWHDWYRSSNVFGYCTMEWPYREARYPGDPNIPTPGASVVEKPLKHNSTAASDFIHIGRYGAWSKGLLTSDAYFTARQALMEDTINIGHFA